MEQNEKDYAFMLRVKEAYEEAESRGESSIRAVATAFDLSRTKVRKILVTLGVIENDLTRRAQALKSQGLNLEQIADELGVSMATVSTYLPYETILYNGEEKSYNATVIEHYRQRNRNTAKTQVHRSQRTLCEYEGENMRERMYKIYRLRLELNTEGADTAVLQKYGKAKKGITRDILVPSDITLHALHYVIQRAFGWQNSHLHHFELPEDIFRRLTLNNFGQWSDYCGIYFRFPSEDMEDLYWDDNYHGDVSIRTWLRRKYTGLYQYHGISEHLMEARYTVVDFMEKNKQIRIQPPFNVWMQMTEEERKKPIIKHPADATCDEIDMLFGSTGTRELLERLKVSEIFAEDVINLIPKNFVRDTLSKCAANADRFVELHNAMADGDGYAYWQEMTRLNGTAHPVTKYLLYQYDYGNGWEVKISIEDVYHVDSGWDHPDRAGFVVGMMTTEDVYDDLTPLSKTGEIIEDELAEQIKAVITKRHPVCIAADGLPVMDDVGGISGYCDLLLALHGKQGGQFETPEEAKQWASGMGWTGRMSKPEKML